MSAVSHTVLRTPARFMNDSRSAISCSRRSGGPSPSAIASSLITPIGMSAAITFQVALESISSRFSQASCAAPRMQASLLVVALVRAGIAIAAHVDQEDVEQRPVRHLAIDAAVPLRHAADRHELVERAAGPRHQQRRAVLGIAGLVSGAAGRPVVGHLMVVPLRQQRHLGVKGAKIFVEQIVFVVAAKLLEGLGDDGFFLRHDVAPDLAIRQLQFPLHRTIGIDVIAGMNEEVGAVVQHGAVGAHAAARGIDAPALPRRCRRTRQTIWSAAPWARCENARPAFRRRVPLSSRFSKRTR